jgi:hypothetical protein
MKRKPNLEAGASMDQDDCTQYFGGANGAGWRCVADSTISCPPPSLTFRVKHHRTL